MMDTFRLSCSKIVNRRNQALHTEVYLPTRKLPFANLVWHHGEYHCAVGR